MYHTQPLFAYHSGLLGVCAYHSGLLGVCAYHTGLLGVCAYHTGLLGVIKGVHIIGSHQGWPRIVHIYAGGGGGGLRFYIASVVEANQVNKLQ